ncbi:MAG: DUF2147 domain-containing protein [Pseudomonadota bacterium]
MKLKTLMAISGLSATVAAASPLDVAGLWLTEAGTGHIEIKDCGDGTPCGTLVWVDPMAANTHLDAKNRTATLRNRPLIGVPIVWGFKRATDAWRGGKIYNPEDGKTFRASLSVTQDADLEVKGCLGPLCRTNIWTRLDASRSLDR